MGDTSDSNRKWTNSIRVTNEGEIAGEATKVRDDIYDAPVMLTVKTGSEIIMYITLALGTVSVIGIGVIVIKRNVLNK